MKPLVSVIMPAYNGEKFIEKSIKSIINQKYDEWELILIDDASTDNTYQVINSFSDSRVRVFRNSSNKGISYSTNLGIKESKGKYIALLDDDDLATPNRLGLQVEYLESREDIDILGGRAVCIDEEDNIIKHDYTPLYNPKMIKAWMHFYNRRFSNGTTMIKSSFIKKNNLFFKEDYYGIQDFKFMADSSKVGNISSIDRVLQYKRIHENEATEHYIKEYGQLRREKFAQLQRESLIDSGFVLNGEELKIINESLPERPTEALNFNQTKALINVLNKIMQQAQEMNIDCLDEMGKVCRNLIIERSLHPLNYEELVRLFE